MSKDNIQNLRNHGCNVGTTRTDVSTSPRESRDTVGGVNIPFHLDRKTEFRNEGSINPLTIRVSIIMLGPCHILNLQRFDGK